MVKAAQDGLRHDAPNGLHRPAARCILAKGQVRANIVVVAGVGRKHAAKMHFAKYYEARDPRIHASSALKNVRTLDIWTRH